MNKQKWLAGLTAVLCSAGALSCFPAISSSTLTIDFIKDNFVKNMSEKKQVLLDRKSVV